MEISLSTGIVCGRLVPAMGHQIVFEEWEYGILRNRDTKIPAFQTPQLIRREQVQFRLS